MWGKGAVSPQHLVAESRHEDPNLPQDEQNKSTAEGSRTERQRDTSELLITEAPSAKLKPNKLC